MKQLETYLKEYTITTNDYDSFNHLSMQAVLDLLQNIAANHAALLNASSEDLAKLNLFWMIVRTEVEVLSSPKLLRKVQVKTWPLTQTRFYFDRMYQIFDETGENLILKARSRWVLVDFTTRKLSTTGLYKYPLNSFYDEVLFTEPFSRFKEGEVNVGRHIVRPSEIDENQHLNNSKYANIVYDFLELTSQQTIKKFAINYSHEVKVGEEIEIFKTIDGPQSFISGKKDGIIIFNSAVEVE